MSKKIKLVGIIFYFLVNVGLRAEIYNYQLVPEEVYTAFHQGLISFQAGKYEQGYVFLERALGRMAEIGVRDLPAYSATLIHLADKIQAQEREKLLTYSRYFAPDCAELYFYRFWYFLDPAHFSLEKAIEEFKSAKRAIGYDLLYRLGLKARLGLSLSFLLKLLILIFSLLGIARGGRIFFHWFMDLFPKEYRLVGWLSFFILLFLPFSFLGDLWTILLWAGILSAIFSSLSFKIVYLILILCFSLEGGVCKRSQELVQLAGRDLAISEFRAGIGLLSRADLDLFRRLTTQNASPSSLLARAEAERRAGEYSTSARLLLTAVKSPELGAIAYNNLACLYLELGELEQAEEALYQAKKLPKPPAEVYYNLSQIYSELRDFDASDQEYQRARELSAEMVSFLDLLKKAGGKNFIPARVPVPAKFIEQDLKLKFQENFFKEGKFRGLFLLLGIVLFSWLGRKRLRLCKYCGRVICEKCLPASGQEDICIVCYRVFISGKVSDPKVKISQRIKVRRYHQLTGWLGVIFSIIFPGAGLIFEERAGAGLGFLILPMIFLSWLWSGCKYHLAIMPFSAGLHIWAGLGFLIYLLLGLASVWAYHRLYYLEV